MLPKIFAVFAAVSGLLSVVLGAFGAHALKGSLEPRLLQAYETGVTYQMSHALALLFLAVMMTVWEPKTAYSVAGVSWAVGTLLFSGSLYLLAVTGMKWLGPVTPIGGVFLIVGWLALAYGVATQSFPR